MWKQYPFSGLWTLVFLCLAFLPASSLGQVLTKAQVSDLITKVEDGTDEFKKYLEKRGDNAREGVSRARSQGRSRRGSASSASVEAQQERISEGTDKLSDAVKDLEKATDRLKRRFRRVQNYLDTRVQVEKVVDEGREINQQVVRGNYGSEVARVWAALRVRINDLARVYGVTPLAL